MFDFANPSLDGTQTESESDDELLYDIQRVSSEIREHDSDMHLCPDPMHVERSGAEMCLASVKFLDDLSDEEARDPHAHGHVAEAVDYIVAFVDIVLSRGQVPDESFASMTELLGPSFLSRLFSLRNVFRGLACKELASSGTKMTVVCWADELLVKLCACILHFATSGRMQDMHKVSGIQSIKVMQDNEARRSATLLPVRFKGLADLLSSKNASPATTRMALTILYGAHVLREQYQDPSSGEIEKAGELDPSMSKHIAKYAATDASPATIYPSVLAEYAMAASLYVRCNSKINDTLDVPFSPHHEHILINLIDTIIDHCSSGLVSEDPTSGPLIMLLNDLGLMRWFWERWGDGSTSVASTALQLTCLWVQYYRHRGGKNRQTQFDVLWAAAPCSFQALLHVVDTPSIAPRVSLNDAAVIERVCDAYIQLTRMTLGDIRYRDIMAEACKKICPYILSPDNNEVTENLRELIVEFLVNVGPDVLRTAFGDATTTEFRWNNRGIVEQVLQTIAGMIADSSEDNPGEQVGWTKRQTLRMKHLLDVLIVFLHARTCAASAVITSTTFMSALVPWASRQPDKRPVTDATQWNTLRASVLMVLGLVYSHFRVCCSVLTKRFPEFDLDAFVNTILDSDRLTLLEICALARYIIATEEDRILDDPVTVLEMWSRIQDTLLSTLQHRFLGDEEAASVALSGTLCKSLLSILKSAGKQTRAMILASPWTQTLRDALHRALKGTAPNDHTLGLCQQLKNAGVALIHMIDRNPECTQVEDSLHLIIPTLVIPRIILSTAMSAAAPQAAPSFVITRTEEWPDADFDLPDDQETLAIDNDGDDLAESTSRIKGSRPSLSGAGAVAKLGGAPVEDEDWDAEFEDAPIKSATASSANSSTSNFTGKITRLGPKETRKVKENVEDWSDDGDLELPEPSHTNFTLARAPLPQPNAPEVEDTGDVSTIKIAKLNFPSVSKRAPKYVEEDDFEADFALPDEMSNLSLRILTPQTSSLLLRKSSTLVEGNGPWGDLTTSSSTFSDTSSMLSMYPPDASPSASSASHLGTETDPSDGDFAIYEDEEEAFDGLILPEGLAGKNLAKHLEIKKQIVPAKIAAENDAKGALTSQSRRTGNEGEDFETGLVIGDEDISITRLRQRRMANLPEYRSKSVPLPRTASGGYRPSSSSRLRTESVMEVLSASKVPSISRSRSPSMASQRSLSRKDSRSSLVSPTNFSSLRPSSVRTASSSHASSSTANLLSIPGSSSISGIAPRPAPLKHQKSLGRLQLSSTSSPTSATMGQKLGRKASLASLAGDPTSGTPSSSSTLSVRSSGFNAPTTSSKARQRPESREETDKKRTYTGPTTPSTNPASLRLTMPTSSSRQKIRPSISNVFPSPSTSTPTDRATSPQPNPRRTPTSPRRVRTRSGASNGGTPSSSISSMASTTAPKVMRKPKRVQAFSDGTELDAFDDLPEDTEKERKYRVQPVGRGNVSASRVEKGSTSSTATGGTLGRRAAAATLRRPPSSASSHGSIDPPKETTMRSLRHKPRVDFPVKVTVPEQAPRRKKPTVTALGGPRKKPMLIRNLGSAGDAKTVGDMKWNPKTLRWEGNEQVLREFDAHAAPSRPALITHMTGSSIGGLMSPTGSMLASGARIVGNMLFDPVRMCWISRLPPEEDEPDVFAGLADDEGADWEDKAGTIRANIGGANATDDWKGSVRSIDSMREMTMSPARSHTRSMSESESEAGDTPSGFGTRRSVRSSFGGQSLHEEVPGVDDTLIASCRAAEDRHKQEMKGWYIRSRSRSRSVKSASEEEVPLRTHLFDIRALATRKY